MFIYVLPKGLRNTWEHPVCKATTDTALYYKLYDIEPRCKEIGTMWMKSIHWHRNGS